jgi:hypothetical protein
MGNSFTIYSFLSLLGCTLTGLLIAWLLYSRKDNLSRSVRIALAAVRAVGITLILWLLFSPLIRRITYTLEKPIVLIAQDNSESVAAFTAPGFDRGKYEQELQQLVKDLSPQYEVKTYRFSNQVAQGFDFGYKGKTSNVTALERKLNDEFANRNVGAIILASDGIFNGEGNGNGLANLQAPLYTIAMGDTIAKKDVLISNINHNDLVYLNNDFKLEINVQAYQCNAASSVLSITENGKVIHQQTVQLKGNLFTKDIPVQLKAGTLGHHRYTVALSPVDEEISARNNTRQIHLEVIDGSQKVLIAADGPHPDIAAWRNAIAANKHHEVTVALGEELLKVKPQDYALIILYQLPGMQSAGTAFVNRLKDVKISLLYVIGLQSMPDALNAVQQGIKFSGDNGPANHNYSSAEQQFSVFDLDASSKKTISSFEPLLSPSGRLQIAGNAQVVLRQRTGNKKPDEPQLFFITDNNKKTGYMLGEGIWKWKLSEERDEEKRPSVFNELISKTVQYLSVKDDKRKFRVYSSRENFDENEPVILSATLYNDIYEPVNTPDVNIEISNEKGRLYPFAFGKADSAYQLDAGILPPGSYTYKASTMLGTKKYQAAGMFYVSKLDAEFQQTIANHHLLYQLSAQTKGKLFAPADLSSIKAELQKSDRMKTLSYEDRRYEELISIKWLFFLILLLLSTEWFIRKRKAAI